MDIASLVGIILGFAMFVFGILSSGASFTDYVDIPSLIITFGGSLAGVIASFKVKELITGFKGFTIAFKERVEDPGKVITNIIDLSNIARKEGLLALEEASNDIEDPFLRKGIMLVVDGTDPELVRGILETELTCLESRHKKVIAVWEKWAELGPAWGMIGTLVGLVAMLNDMDDPATIGPAMAVALITTLYGSLIANWLCNPTANKLSVNNDMEMVMKDIMVEGLLSIQAGENPRVIEEKLKSFLSPSVRDSVGMDAGGGEA
ncbi:MAG: motility protein A [Lachnospiraceae bacterium]|nr:motility protein A [Lachnospiraceae bacterium]